MTFLEYETGANVLKNFIEFLTRCRKYLTSESNLFWVSLQSNLFADVSHVVGDFEEAAKEMKDELRRKGWIFPTLKANMRNQVNIANLDIESRLGGSMQSMIEKLKSGTNLIGEIPVLFNVNGKEWEKKKVDILKYCIELMEEKSEKNVVFLWNNAFGDFEGFVDAVKTLASDKKVVRYPSENTKEEGVSNVKDFAEKDDHILITESHYFNGCEAANIIIIMQGSKGIRNYLLRGVQNIIVIQLTDVGTQPNIHGMKIDNRFRLTIDKTSEEK